MKKALWTFLVTAVVSTGCVTAPAPQGGTSVAGYVGDRASVEMNEIVASVRAAGLDKQFVNLHITIGVVINPRKVTTYQPYEVESIMRRLEPRVSAEVLKLVLGTTVSVSGLPELRDQIQIRTASTIQEALTHWTEAAAYEVRSLVLSMYLTDGSVGKTRTAVSRWW